MIACSQKSAKTWPLNSGLVEAEHYFLLYTTYGNASDNICGVQNKVWSPEVQTDVFHISDGWLNQNFKESSELDWFDLCVH